MMHSSACAHSNQQARVNESTESDNYTEAVCKSLLCALSAPLSARPLRRVFALLLLKYLFFVWHLCAYQSGKAAPPFPPPGCVETKKAALALKWLSLSRGASRLHRSGGAGGGGPVWKQTRLSLYPGRRALTCRDRVLSEHFAKKHNVVMMDGRGEAAFKT